MIPHECKMPDLSDLDVPLTRHLLLHSFVGDRGLTNKEVLYRGNFVRLVDKAIREYQSARAALITQIEETKRPQKERIIYLFEFTNHFENCLNAANRLLRQWKRNMSKSSTWKVPRVARRSIETYSETIPDIRDAAQHMEERIQEDKLQKGQAVMLYLGDDGDRATLAGYEIRFEELSWTIRRLHQIACVLLTVN